MRSRFFKIPPFFLLPILVLTIVEFAVAQESVSSTAAPSQGTDLGASSSSVSSTDNSGLSQQSGHLPLPDATPSATPSSSSLLQVTPPSVVLPTPALPPPALLPEASPTPSAEQAPTPQPTPVFNPPSAQRLNLPSAQPAGNPNFAPASIGMPSLKIDDDSAGAPGALAGMFDWAKKLRFQAALRGGFDNNVNSGEGTNAIASAFSNLNGGVNYRFGAPRLNINVDLVGGVTRYFNNKISKPFQETMGLGLDIDYRLNPRLVLTLNSSSSFQRQPNITLIGTANSSNNAYYYTANSLDAAYQWNDLFTTVSRLNYLGSYYPKNTSYGFNNPGFTQSFRYLVRPTTTAVVDYNANYYAYQNSAYNSMGQSLLGGFDHIFNPKWFWNFRVGGETRQSQKTSPYFGPSLNSNFSWAFAKRSSLSWTTYFGTQPSGLNNASYAASLNSGLNYSQGIFTKLTFNVGAFYLLSQYPKISVGSTEVPSYNQNNLQANASLAYTLNRIINLSLGYQYITATSSSSLGQEYNRGITYLQISAGL